MAMEITINVEKTFERGSKNIIDTFSCENANLVISCFWNIKKLILSVKFIILWVNKVLGDKSLTASFWFFFYFSKQGTKLLAPTEQTQKMYG